MTLEQFIDRIMRNTDMHEAMCYEDRVQLCSLLRAGQAMRDAIRNNNCCLEIDAAAGVYDAATKGEKK